MPKPLQLDVFLALTTLERISQAAATKCMAINCGNKIHLSKIQMVPV
jgi:hypothetical protein